MPRPDGGPAFPQPISTSPSGDTDFPCNWNLGGMTLRAYFAGQVIADCVGRQIAKLERERSYDPDSEADVISAIEDAEFHNAWPRRAAVEAVAIADALIAELEKP